MSIRNTAVHKIGYCCRCGGVEGWGFRYYRTTAHARTHTRTLSLDMLSSRCLLSAALTMISSKILYRPGTYETWRLTIAHDTSSYTHMSWDTLSVDPTGRTNTAHKHEQKSRRREEEKAAASAGSDDHGFAVLTWRQGNTHSKADPLRKEVVRTVQYCDRHWSARSQNMNMKQYTAMIRAVQTGRACRNSTCPGVRGRRAVHERETWEGGGEYDGPPLTDPQTLTSAIRRRFNESQQRLLPYYIREWDNEGLL